ncbi:MAG: tripartite tricarboxylate transporter substrate binding protein [Betaproteobacteria bacterium]
MDTGSVRRALPACTTALLCLVACLLPAPAPAQEFPARPLRLVVPFPPGGGTDGAARSIAQRLAESLGQPVLVDNRPGGGGLVAWGEVSRAVPDGHTLVVIANNLRLYPVMQIATSFDPDRDLVPVATLASVPMVLAGSGKLPPGGLKELVAEAKSASGKINAGTVGNGSPHHLALARFASETGITLTYIPYKGTAPLVADLLGNQIDIAFIPLSVALPHLRAGKLRSYGIALPQRAPLAPELPTLAENGGPSFDASYWYAVAAPRATPEAVIRRLNGEIVKILDMAPVRESLARQGFEPMPASVEQSAKYLADEITKWSGPIKAHGIRAD